MGDIVKHVEQALRNKEWCDIDEQARAAARATLEYLRENVSAQAISEGESFLIGTDAPTWVSRIIFRAMLSAALNDIKGGTG